LSGIYAIVINNENEILMEFVMSLLPENLKYALSHEWASAEAGNIVRVGITDFAQEELGDLVYVELPDVGRRVGTNESCATVESVKTASDISSPVSGEIVDVNTAVVDDPEKINDDPYGAWLFCVKADDMSQLEQLLTLDAYQKMITG
jgi:glycine cleavage system H protein